MGNYCTYDQIELLLFKPSADHAGQIGAIISAASRMIDREVAVVDDYFAKVVAGDDGITDKTLYGSGTAYLKLPPYVGDIEAEDVEYSDTSLTVPAFTVRGDDRQYLMAERGYCWALDEPIVISARWGFEAVPAEINQACIELSIAMWRTSDPARERAMSDGSDEEFRIAKIPARVKEICALWKRKTRGALFA